MQGQKKNLQEQVKVQKKIKIHHNTSEWKIPKKTSEKAGNPTGRSIGYISAEEGRLKWYRVSKK